MSTIRLLFIFIVTSSMLNVTAKSAFAIRIQLQSAAVPFSNDYPRYARTHVLAALKTENCDFIDGHSTMRVSTLNFAGNTTAINELLQKLADCPAAGVTVSFAEMEHKCDWRVVHTVTGNEFRVIVNLQSNQIVLDELKIPPAKGPNLKR